MLSAGHARALLPLSTELQEQAASTVAASNLSVRQTEQLVKRLMTQPKEKPKKDPAAVDYVAEAERDLSTRLGRACHIAHGKKKGRIEIEYYGVDDLNDLLEALGDRPAALCRELAKLHEETVRTTLSQALAHYRESAPRGEFVLVVAGAEPAEEAGISLEDGVRLVLARRAAGERMKDAVRQVAADTGLNRNELYAAALAAGGSGA